MNRNKTIVVDGITYYHEMLWEALVQQNLEMGMQQNVDRGRFNKLHAEAKEARRETQALRDELDYALEKLDDAIQRVVDFQQGD